MKTLKKVTLKDAPKEMILSAGEQKLVIGGAVRSTDCSTTCKNGATLEITNCNGDCSSKNNYSVTCTGETQTLTKTCKDN